jgi:hypothetical protein
MIPAAVAQTLNERAGRDRLSGRVLLLRTCQPCGRSSLGFTWPLQIGAEVNAPDWDPRDCCGYGLHGLPWGEGNGRLLNWSADVVWLVWSAPSDSVVEITEGGGGKAKAPRGRIEHVGDRASATAYLAEHGRPGSAIVGGTSTSGDRGTSVSGYRGTSVSGDHGTSTSGYRGTSVSGYRGTSVSGEHGTSTSGYGGMSTSGDGGTSVSGYGGTSVSGYGGTSMSGYGGTSMSSDGGTSTSGDDGTSVSGDDGMSTSGDGGTSVSGYGGTVQGGPGAVLILQWYGGGVYRRASVVVGDGGIKPDTRYRVNNRGEWLEVEE